MARAKKAPTMKLDVGLDLTSNEMRCVALSRRGKQLTLERFSIGEIPSSAWAAGRVAEPVQLGAQIKELLHENGINARRAIVSLSGKAAITRIIELPKMGAAQTRQAISLQINQYVPFPPGDTVYDYKVLPSREGANPSMQEVLLVATRATTVDSMIEMLRSANIEPEGVKITTLAAWNLLETGLSGYAQAVGVIDVRDTVTDLSFFLNGQFRLSRPVELGFNNIIGKVAQILGVSPGEAEEYLKAEPVDLTIPEDEIDPTEDNRMREALLSVFSSFVSELIRSIRYYESQAQRSERVGKMMLFGNIEIFPNLQKYLEDQTGLEISVVNLSSLVQYRQGAYSVDHLNQHASRMPVAAGLALEHFKKKKELNLMPQNYYIRKINFNIALIGIFIIAVLVASGWLWFNRETTKLDDVETQVAQKEQRMNSLKPSADQFDQVKSEIQQEMPRFNQVMGLFKTQFIWPEIMEELGNRTHDRVWIEEVDFEASTHSIDMTCIAVDRVDMLQFAINLDTSPFFTNTVLAEKADSGGGGSGGGGRSGGSSGPGAAGRGAASEPAPGGGGAGITSAIKPMQDYRLPRFDFQPGASIEDYFRRDYQVTSVISWEFEISTDLQTEIYNQSVYNDVVQIEEVINDVLST